MKTSGPGSIVACICVMVVAAVPASVRGEDTELRPRRPICGSTPEIRLQYLDGTRKAMVQRARLADHDLFSIAVLEDDGTLVVNGFTQSDNIAARFYASHADEFDFLNIFTASTFATDVDPEAGFAFEQNVANDVSGINLPFFNEGGAIAPGVTRLRSLLNMNDLGEYCEDPGEKLPAFLNTFSGLSVLGQEAGHMVGAFVTANNADILGRGNSHWSYFFETDGSALEGNGWLDHGNGTFTTISSGDGMSQLDNYLWGFLLPAQVTNPMFVITNPLPLLNNGDSALPAEGVTVSGVAVAVTVDNVIAVHGARIPSALTSQKTYTMAWILVIPQGTAVAPHDLEKIDDFRNQWEEEFFVAETGGIGAMVSVLGATAVTADFESRLVAGDPGLTVTFDNDSFGSITSFLWEFGDGSTSTARHPTHTYTTAGAFDVTLTVNGAGGPGIATKPAAIRTGTTTPWFADDFESDQGWTLEPGGTATLGLWTRADPSPTFVRAFYGADTVSAAVQPSDDHTPSGTLCWVTGNDNASLGSDDVDAGHTSIVSPVIDLSNATDPVLEFWHWFSNNSGAVPGKDSLVVSVSSDGGSSWTPAKVFQSSHHYWRQEQVRLADLVPLTATMRIRFRCADGGAGSLVEAAVDDMRIFQVDVPTSVPEAGATHVAMNVTGPNPFRELTLLQLLVPAPGDDLQLDVYSVDGKRVRSLLHGRSGPGAKTVTWDGRDDDGTTVASGAYFFRLRTPQVDIVRKVLRID